jgi:DNA-binding NarL/FixJ family response regulator
LARGEPSVAAALLRRRLAEVGDNRLDCAALIELLGQAQIAVGEVSDAVARAEGLVELGEENGCPLIIGHGQRLLGMALATSDLRAAYTHLELALSAFTRAEVPYRAAQTRLAIARLVRGADVDLAVAEARSAFTALEDLGARRDADDAAALLRDLGVKAARTGPKNVGRLTQREQEVLSLLADGLSNPEISARLFVSRKTVEHHVARILAKLGLRSRAEAAVFVARSAP